jgi:hypothetical protein
MLVIVVVGRDVLVGREVGCTLAVSVITPTTSIQAVSKGVNTKRSLMDVCIFIFIPPAR